MIAMRPTPVRHSDDELAPVCVALGIATVPAELKTELRALANLLLNVQINPNPRARRPGRSAGASRQGAFGFDDKYVDFKLRQANDFNKD